MDGLRWILLISGLLVVAGVYLYSRRQIREPAGSADEPRRREPAISVEKREPSIEGEADGFEPDPSAAAAADDEEAEEDAPRPEKKIVTIRLVARDQEPFAGDELVLSLRGIGMRHGRFGIFHRYEGNDEEAIIFSAASLVEPGSFDLENIRDQKIPGITLFMVLPGPIDGARAFDLMMTAARAIAQALHAELLDESGSTLSIQRERYLREEIIKYQHGIMVA